MGNCSFFVAGEARVSVWAAQSRPGSPVLLQEAGQCLSPAGADRSHPGNSAASPGSCRKGWKCARQEARAYKGPGFMKVGVIVYFAYCSATTAPHMAGSRKGCDTEKSSLSDAHGLSSTKALGFGVSKEGFEPPKAALPHWLFALAWAQHGFAPGDLIQMPPHGQLIAFISTGTAAL